VFIFVRAALQEPQVFVNTTHFKKGKNKNFFCQSFVRCVVSNDNSCFARSCNYLWILKENRRKNIVKLLSE